VVKNIKQFVASVKRVTGNQKDAEEKGKSKSVKPGEFVWHFDLFWC
jgi:large subunit ribosomal protein L1